MDQPTWKLLVIEDDEEDYYLIRQMLMAALGPTFQTTWAASFDAGRQALQTCDHDAVLLDYYLGDHNGIELVREAAAGEYPAPIILFTGRGSREVDLEAMAAGATLYLSKDEATPLLLERAIRYAIDHKRTQRTLQTQTRLLEAAKAELENEKHRLEAVMDALPVGVAITDSRGASLQVNRAYDDIWRGPRPVPQSVDDYAAYQAWWADTGQPVQPEEWASAQAVQRGELVNNQVLQIQRFDGSRGYVINSAAPLRDSTGEIVGSAVAIRDITSLWLTERALHESEQRYAITLASIGDAVIATDVQGGITFANSVAEKLTGWPLDEALHRPIQQVFHIINELTRLDAENPIEKVLKTGGVVGLANHTLLVRRDGVEIPIDDSGAPIKDKDGQVIGVVLVFRDITGRRRSEEAIQEYSRKLEESNRDLENFAFMASHDLQEPLRKIEAFSNLLMQDTGSGLGETQLDYLTRIQNAAIRMRRMIDDLLALSRLSTTARPFTQVDLNRVVHAVLEDLEIHLHQTGGHVTIGELPVVDADPVQMQQMFQNLLSNALKFHRPDVPPEIAIQSHLLSDDQVQISVTDNGIGFDMVHAGRLFQPFQRLQARAKYDGTGMGLSICRKIAERHGGTISVISQPDEGATFTITLPLKLDH